jgi:PhzF family phenazine biosynthesis protein
MKVKIYQVDAFSDQIFRGNPAAVCILDEWLEESKMQSIASENNLAETAFVVQEGKDFSIRWFTPEVEVDLCGHATLAAAHVLFNYFNHKSSTIKFNTKKSGLLKVRNSGKMLELDFPADRLKKVAPTEMLIEAIGLKPIEAYKGKTDYLLIYNSQYEIESLKPDFDLLSASESRGVIVSAKGQDADFVSRFFAP